jgi:hypothetical protein
MVYSALPFIYGILWWELKRNGTKEEEKFYEKDFDIPFNWNAYAVLHSSNGMWQKRKFKDRIYYG